MNNIPSTPKGHKICIVCEGFEEHKYLSKLLSLNVWNGIYDFTLINAKSASNVFPVYDNEYRKDSYELVLAFCDTDKAPYREYSQIKSKFIEQYDSEDAVKTIIYANPCTMQIILSHFGDVSLKNQGKKTNADVIEKYTSVKNYDAHEDQIDEICRKIFRRTYAPMKERISNINLGDETSASTNFIIFLNYFESDSVSWIQELSQTLE